MIAVMFTTFETLLELALTEDLSEKGDITSHAIFKNEETKAELICKKDGILAGLPHFEKVFNRVDRSIAFTAFKREGDALAAGERIATVQGNVIAVLNAERTAINFIGYLSGIATATRKYVDLLAGLGNTILLDTRKTLPGYRELAKYAVRQGGGKNHRMGLFDMVMIKDNHIDSAGSITAAVEKVREKWGEEFSIEVECRTAADVREAAGCRVDIVMLDNMDAGEIKKILSSIDGKNIKFEASGNMDLEKIKTYGGLGLDYISVGGLTHSVTSLDYSLRIM